MFAAWIIPPIGSGGCFDGSISFTYHFPSWINQLHSSCNCRMLESWDWELQDSVWFRYVMSRFGHRCLMQISLSVQWTEIFALLPGNRNITLYMALTACYVSLQLASSYLKLNTTTKGLKLIGQKCGCVSRERIPMPGHAVNVQAITKSGVTWIHLKSIIVVGLNFIYCGIVM